MFGKVINFVKSILGKETKHEEIIAAPYKVETPEVQVEEKPTPRFGTAIPSTPNWQTWPVTTDAPIVDVAPVPVKKEKEDKPQKSADIVEFPKKARAPKKPKNEVAANDEAPKNARKPRNTTTNTNNPPKAAPVKTLPVKPAKPKKK